MSKALVFLFYFLASLSHAEESSVLSSSLSIEGFSQLGEEARRAREHYVINGLEVLSPLEQYEESSLENLAKHTVFVRVFIEPQKYLRCTGVILGQRQILTAAHCFESYKQGGKVDVVFVNEKAFIKVSPAKTIWFPESLNYNYSRSSGYQFRFQPSRSRFASYSNNNFDLALIVLKDRNLPSPFSPIEVNTNEQRLSSVDEVVAVGMGATENENDPIVPRIIDLRLRHLDNDSGNLSVIYDPLNESGLCFGDSGGPLFIRDGDYYSLLGISHAIRSEDCAPPYEMLMLNVSHRWDELMQDLVVRIRIESN